MFINMTIRLQIYPGGLRLTAGTAILYKGHQVRSGTALDVFVANQQIFVFPVTSCVTDSSV